MKDNLFFDTNILVYMFDKSEKEKNEISKKLIRGLRNKANLFISVQVLNEFVAIVTKKIENPITFDKLKKILDIIQKVFWISPLSWEDTFMAVEIKLKYQYAFWDSLIISSAMANTCKKLYTEDLQDSQIIDEKLTIINPYK
jgi:predicted nucleic acid-binding protein